MILLVKTKNCTHESRDKDHVTAIVDESPFQPPIAQDCFHGILFFLVVNLQLDPFVFAGITNPLGGQIDIN